MVKAVFQNRKWGRRGEGGGGQAGTEEGRKREGVSCPCFCLSMSLSGPPLTNDYK